MPRLRSLGDINHGTFDLFLFGGSIFHDTGHPLYQWNSSDDIGRGTDHPLVIDKYTNYTVPMNGTWSDGGIYDGSNWVNYLYPYEGAFTHDGNLDTVDTTTAATRAIARSNPSRPGLSPLELLQDIKDLPGQLRDLGRLINTPKHKLINAKEVANQNLALQFGWLPLVSDVKALLSFHSSVNKRAEELHRLYGRGGLRRRITIHRASSTSELNQAIGQFGSHFVTVKGDLISTIDQWGVVRWLPSVLPPWSQTEDGINKQARKLVEGLTFEGLRHGLWNVIPWSWLVDWFSNVGDYVDTYSGTCPAYASQCNIMKHRVTYSTYTRTDSYTGITGGNGVVYRETKERFLGTPGLTANLPFISANQLSILGSLFIQRSKRKGLLSF